MQITGEVNAPGTDEHGRPKVVALNADGSLQMGGSAPATAGSVALADGSTSVAATAAALSGESGTGFTLLNNEPDGGKTIYIGGSGVSSATGFPLEPGDAIDRPGWKDLSLVYAIASSAGADLRVLPL